MHIIFKKTFFLSEMSGKFAIDYSKRPCKCKHCEKEIPIGSVRLAKLVPNYFEIEFDDPGQAHAGRCVQERRSSVSEVPGRRLRRGQVRRRALASAQKQLNVQLL
jgi:hypothetical protein